MLRVLMEKVVNVQDKWCNKRDGNSKKEQKWNAGEQKSGAMKDTFDG